MKKRRIYLDNNATTFIDPRIVDVVVHNLSQAQGNPSSIHSYGQEAKAVLNKARRTIADYLKVKPGEIIFTSNGTESMNFLIKGVLNPVSKGHIITSSTEHACVFATCQSLQSQGWSVDFISPGLYGALTPETVEAAIRPDTCLITLMAVNNETGVKTDISAIAALALKHRIPFMVDGVALLGKEPFEIPAGVTGMGFSGHKFHAPQGCGFAFIRSGVKMHPLLLGGEQESGRRGGTENLIGIIAMAEAIRLLNSELPEASERMERLRDKFEKGVLERLPTAKINGSGPRVVNTTNMTFPGLEGETLLTRLDMAGVAASHGSACSSGALEPSRILLNMGIPRREAESALRFSLSRMTTEADIDQAVETLASILPKIA